KNLRIVDLRPAAKYAVSHLPGAVNLNSDDLDVQTNGVQDLAAPAKVAELLGNVGIGDASMVVLYDDQKTLYSARVFWVLDYLGHQDAAVLNGGFPKWQAEKREVTRTVPTVEKAAFTPKPDPAKVADAAYIKANMGEKSVVFCDARTPGEFNGTDVYAERGGHIPGAKNLNWEDNVLPGETQILKDAARLKELYDQAGITPDKEVVTYCQTGIRGAQAYYVLKLLGYQKVRNYDGSWQDWAKDSNLPIEGGKKG
ncbi:MAG: sulfurtransferase, partial [Chloroflexi bacterium]|nr:sulfurtransferase [Chloroflexota bacterium]